MNLKKELLHCAQSLIMLGMALFVGVNSALHFLEVRERREAAFRPAIEKLEPGAFDQHHTKKETTGGVLFKSRRPSVQTPNDTGRFSRGEVIEIVMRSIPAWVVFFVIYFIVNRLVKKTLKRRST